MLLTVHVLRAHTVTTSHIIWYVLRTRTKFSCCLRTRTVTSHLSDTHAAYVLVQGRHRRPARGEAAAAGGRCAAARCARLLQGHSTTLEGKRRVLERNDCLMVTAKVSTI